VGAGVKARSEAYLDEIPSRCGGSDRTSGVRPVHRTTDARGSAGALMGWAGLRMQAKSEAAAR
jgi:hypothetical protein